MYRKQRSSLRQLRYARCLILASCALLALAFTVWMATPAGCTEETLKEVRRPLEEEISRVKQDVERLSAANAGREQPQTAQATEARTTAPESAGEARPSPYVAQPAQPPDVQTQPPAPAPSHEVVTQLRGAGQGVAPVHPEARSGGFRVLLFCYNRPEYLTHTLESISRNLPTESAARFPLTISQDGKDHDVETAANRFITSQRSSRPEWRVEHVQHPQEMRPGEQGYHRLAQHYGWGLARMFDQEQAQHVIILEDDMEIAPDFFQYMEAMAGVMDRDESVWTVSAWNDHGQRGLVDDAERVYRSDFFPGLGWMMPRRVWLELGPKWPAAYWDDWMREPDQRRGRATLRPEVCRTYTFGSAGTSNGEFFARYLEPIKLNDRPVAWTAEGAQHLVRSAYDPAFEREVQAAQPVAPVDARSGRFPAGTAVRVEYEGVEQGRGSFVDVARKVGIMDNVKAGVPRGAYHGVVPLSINGVRVFVAPKDFRMEGPPA